MAIEKYYNYGFVPAEIYNITSSILSTDNPATFTVSGPNGLSNTPNLRIRINNEILLVTSVNIVPSNWIYTAERAQEGTTAGNHSTSTPLYHLLTERSFRNILLADNSFLPSYPLTYNPIADRALRRKVYTDRKMRQTIESNSDFNFWFDFCPVKPLDVGTVTGVNLDLTSISNENGNVA